MSTKITTYYRFNERAIYSSMKQRCLNPKDPAYAGYGGRGITVCSRWIGEDGFINFIEDVGCRPGPEYTLERRDNDKGYSKENCYWATRKEQMRNTRRSIFVEIEGKKIHAMDLAEILGIRPSTIYARIHKGYSGDRLFSPTYTPRTYKINDDNLSIKQLSDLYGIEEAVLRRRIQRNNNQFKPIMVEVSDLQLKKKTGKFITKESVDPDSGMTLETIQKQTGIKMNTLMDRFKRGLRGKDLIQPISPTLIYEYEGNRYSLMELSSLSGIHISTLFHRLFKQRMTVEKAMEKKSK